MYLAVWAARNGVGRVSAYRWFGAGLLPVPARRVGRPIVVDEPSVPAGPGSRTAVYARVCSADRKADLDPQVGWVTAWATTRQIRVDDVVTVVGSAVNGQRRKFFAVLRDAAVRRIVVEHRDRCCRWALRMFRAPWSGRGANWLWSIRPGLMTTWCGI